MNISEQGLCLVAPGPLAVDAEVRVRVWPLPISIVWPPYLKGRVAACSELGDGFALGVTLRFSSARQASGWKKLVANAAAKVVAAR